MRLIKVNRNEFKKKNNPINITFFHHKMNIKTPTTMIRIKDGIELHNARRIIRNKEIGKDANYNLLNNQRLGMILYEDSKYGSIAVSMSRLNTGAATTINIEWVTKICDALGVDPNFLFGFPSKHDKDFKKLCQ